MRASRVCLLPLVVLLVHPSLGVAAQRQFDVEFTLGDKRFTERVGADSSEDAKRLILASHPGAVIWNVREVK